LLDSVDKLYAYYYWMWKLTLSVWMLPLCWCGCELTLSLACRLRVALIRNGMVILVLLSIVTYCFMNYVVEPFGLRISLSCYVEAVVPRLLNKLLILK